MEKYFEAIVPVLLLISLGYFAKRIKLVDSDIARKLIKFLFTIPLPIVVFFSFAGNPMTLESSILPLIAILLSGSLMALSFLIAKGLKFSRQRIGTVLVATGISSTLLYVLPLVTFFYGAEGSKYLFLFDFGNGLFAWTVVYYLAGLFGNKKNVHIQKTLLTFLKNPMLWALIMGVIMGLLQVQMPAIFTKIASQMSGFANPLLLICVGIFLDFGFFKNKQNLWQLVITAVLIMGLSFCLALFMVNLFGLADIARKVVLMCALAPAGSLTVAFSAEHELDLEFASAIVALTMTIGVLLIPILALI